jgi:serine/threonine protein kinase
MLYRAGTIIKSQNEQEITLESPIGSGGFGEVYLGYDKNTKDKYAIKFLRNPFDEKLLKSFFNEGDLALNIDNENVIKYYYFHDGSTYENLPPYIVMEYANDGTLRDLINVNKSENAHLQMKELIPYFNQLLTGIQAINNKIVHRDIKPENILISEGLIKISDFGISKVIEEATRTSTFKGFGCVPYIAPEAWFLEENTIKMDIYSMGIVFYELACLIHPLKVDTNDIEEWKNAHIYQSVIPPTKINENISSIVERIIMKMMEKDKTKRFDTWEEIFEQLSKHQLPETPDDHFIENAIKKRTNRIAEAEKVKLKIEKKQKEKTDFIEKIKYQLENDLYKPLKEFIEKFNQKSDNENKITITLVSDSLTINFHFSSSTNITLHIEPIFEENFHRKISVKEFGEFIEVDRLMIPKYNHKHLMAWGLIQSNYAKGMNLLLVESEDSMYGTWITLLNTNHILSNRRPRLPEPFAFGIDELEKELPLINAMHIYTTKHQVLDLNMLKEFISEYY